MKYKYTVGSLFAGIGGIDISFKKAGFKILWANEINKKACETYAANFSHPIINDDIKNLDLNNLPKVNVIVAGFPCQSFSTAGLLKGFEDKRGAVFFDLMNVVKALNPDIVFLENVKNLKFHDGGKTLARILLLITECGYQYKLETMNACDYSMRPQNRDRIYIVCFKTEFAYQAFVFPSKKRKPIPLEKILEKEVDKRFYYDVNQYPILKTWPLQQKRIYQFRNRSHIIENKRIFSPTLTASMGRGGNRIPFIIDDYGIRRITPQEFFKLQGFPKDFVFPQSISTASMYSQLGNSVSVPLVTKIAKNIKKAMEHSMQHK